MLINSGRELQMPIVVMVVYFFLDGGWRGWDNGNQNGQIGLFHDLAGPVKSCHWILRDRKWIFGTDLRSVVSPHNSNPFGERCLANVTVVRNW